MTCFPFSPQLIDAFKDISWDWKPMKDAPKNGDAILVLSKDGTLEVLRCGVPESSGNDDEVDLCWYTIDWQEAMVLVSNADEYYSGWMRITTLLEELWLKDWDRYNLNQAEFHARYA